jgi:hypothetical protein
MTQEQVLNYAATIIVLGALGVGLLSVTVGRLVALFDWACGHWQGLNVKDYVDDATDNMSSTNDDGVRLSPSSVQTDNRQTDRQPEIKAPGREELLTLYATMRAAGISREKARPALKAVGLPLDNNLWVEAAPQVIQPTNDNDVLITPFAGRRTKASYYPDDPELEYQAPR